MTETRRAEAEARGYDGETCGECGNFTLMSNRSPDERSDIRGRSIRRQDRPRYMLRLSNQ